MILKSSFGIKFLFATRLCARLTSFSDRDRLLLRYETSVLSGKGSRGELCFPPGSPALKSPTNGKAPSASNLSRYLVLVSLFHRSSNVTSLRARSCGQSV